LNDASSLTMALSRICPDEIYNLAAQSHVKVSFEIPGYTADVAGLGTLRLLEAIRELGLPCRFYQASSSEMFGSTPPPAKRMHPISPAQSLRLRQGIRPSDHCQLPRKLRGSCL